MKKYLMGFFVSTVTMLILAIINDIVNYTLISDFLVGWLSCTAFMITFDHYAEKEEGSEKSE